MSEPIEVMQRFIREYQSENRVEVAEELLAADFRDHTPFPGFGGSREDVIRLFTILRAAFPDLRAEVVEQFADGDRVATRKTFHGTHNGPFLGIAPTGKKVAFRVIDLVRITDGKIREHWNVVDAAELMAQLQS